MTKPLIVGANGLPSQLPDSTPLQTNSPCCTVSGSATLTSGVNTPIPFAGQAGNFIGWFSTVPSRLYIEFAGFYLCGYSIVFAGNTTGVRDVWIRRNSGAGTNARHSFNGSAASTAGNSLLLYLASGEYLDLMASQNSGGNLSVNSASLYISRQSN